MPEPVQGVFSVEALPLMERYAEWLATEGVVRGLIGPREAPRLWERHLANCVGVLEAMSPDARSLCDVGTGAGLPGLVLAIVSPTHEVCLVEPLLRRVNFLSEVVGALSLTNVEVVRARAEELHGRRSFDVVTSRAVAPLVRLVRWSMPLVNPTGELVAMKGGSAQDEVDQSAVALRKARCAPAEVLTVGSAHQASTATVVRVRWADPSRVSLPTASRPAYGKRGRDGRSSRSRRR